MIDVSFLQTKSDFFSSSFFCNVDSMYILSRTPVKNLREISTETMIEADRHATLLLKEYFSFEVLDLHFLYQDLNRNSLVRLLTVLHSIIMMLI